MRSLVLAAAILVTSTSAFAGNCGVPCRKCAAEMGYTVDAWGDFNKGGGRGSFGSNTAFERCLERERAAAKR